MTSAQPTEHQEEESNYRASKLIQTDTENYPAEGSWHLWDELPTFANQWVGFYAFNVLGPRLLLRHCCNSTPASSREKNCLLKITEVMLSWLAGGTTGISGK